MPVTRRKTLSPIRGTGGDGGGAGQDKRRETKKGKKPPALYIDFQVVPPSRPHGKNRAGAMPLCRHGGTAAGHGGVRICPAAQSAAAAGDA